MDSHTSSYEKMGIIVWKVETGQPGEEYHFSKDETGAND